MSMIAAEKSAPYASDGSGSPAEKSWTITEYRTMHDLGILSDEPKTELIYGKIYENMPLNSKHSGYTTRISRNLTLLFYPKFDFRSEQPVVLNKTESMPQPDIAVCRHQDHDYIDRHPTPEDIFVLVELSDSTLYFDRNTKREMYAEEGIQEYWIINIKREEVEVYLNPLPEEKRYRSQTSYKWSEVIDSPTLGQLEGTRIFGTSIKQ